MNTQLKRVLLVMHHYGFKTNIAFAKTIGVKITTFNEQVAGKNGLSMLTINGIASAFPDVSMEWLLRGKGEMLVSHIAQAQENETIKSLLNTIRTLQSLVDEKDKRIYELSKNCQGTPASSRKSVKTKR